MHRKVVVFDIDGTLSDPTHRMHLVNGKKKDYDIFFNLVHLDDPHYDMIDLTETFDDAFYTIVLCTGRPERTRKDTEEWLHKHDVKYVELYMRPDGDHRPDYKLKVQQLEQVVRQFAWPWVWFEDRDGVVKALRKEGVRVLQVKEGNY